MNRGELLRRVPVTDVLGDKNFREILEVLDRAGQVDKTTLKQRIFCSQQFRAGQSNYEFYPSQGMAAGDDLYPLSADLSYDIDSLILVGAIVEHGRSLELSGEYRSAIEKDPRPGVNSDFLQELQGISDNEMSFFARCIQLKALLVEKRMTEEQMVDHVKNFFYLDDDQTKVFTNRVGRLQQLAANVG